MKGWRTRQSPLGIFCVLISLFVLSCATRVNMKNDPFYSMFFEKTSLIMTEEEIAIYRNLPDEGSRAQFIKEFWEIRDPDPLTEVNENRAEFERRVAFANQWFDKTGGCFGARPPQKMARSWGWNTNKGRLYIVLGPPDKICLNDSLAGWEIVDRERGDFLCRAVGWRWEIYEYQMFFQDYPDADPDVAQSPNKEFISDRAFSTVSVNTELMNRAKLELVSREYAGLTRSPFRFKAAYEEGSLIFTIPIKGISFVDKEGRLGVDFLVRANVYCDHRKIDSIRETHPLAFVEDELLDKKDIEFRLPYQPRQKGEYLFDVVLSYRVGETTLVYRNYAKKKL